MEQSERPASADQGGEPPRSEDPEGSSTTAGDPTGPAPVSFLRRLLGGTAGNEANAREHGTSPLDLGPAFQFSAPGELAMVKNIMRLRDLRVEDVMTPRADIIAVAEDSSLDQVISAFQLGSYSRLPVYRETLDDPIGFVHLKDLALSYGFGQSAEPSGFRLSDHIRTALFVPPSMRIAALLQKMQGERVHMALVIDEFGGVDGLITIEDLVEQIVGDIEDEHDREEDEDWVQQSESVYIASARADVRAFAEAIGVKIVPDDWEEDIDTLGGLVFMLANRVPTRGEVIMHPLGHEFQVIDADARRIKRLKLTLDTQQLPARQAAE